jgi:hypothetical protein
MTNRLVFAVPVDLAGEIWKEMRNIAGTRVMSNGTIWCSKTWNYLEVLEIDKDWLCSAEDEMVIKLKFGQYIKS